MVSGGASHSCLYCDSQADTSWPSDENGPQLVARCYCGIVAPELPLLGLHLGIRSHFAQRLRTEHNGSCARSQS
jgi:hypothetical protein